MTQRDVFDSNADLIEHCGQLLAGQPWTQLDIARRGSRLTITTSGLDHVDIYADGHPAGPGVPVRKDGTIRVDLPNGAGAIEAVGFRENTIRQRRRLFPV